MSDADPKLNTLATEGAENDQAQSQDNQAQESATAAGGEALKLEGFDEKDNGILGRFKTQNSLAKSYLELFRKLDKTVTIPGESASAEERTAFYKKLGRPESSDEYELDGIFLPDGVTKIDTGDGAFRKIAHETNLTKAQAKAIHKWAATTAVDGIVKLQKQFKERRDAADAALRQEHGLGWEEKKALIPKVTKMYGDGGLIQFLNEGPGNDPRLLRFLIWVGDQFSEETLRGGKPVQTIQEREPGVLDYSAVRPELSGKNRFRSVR